MRVSAIGDDESAYEQGNSYGKCFGKPPTDIMLYVVAKKHVSAKSSKVIEEPEGVPFASAKGIVAYIFIKIG